MAAWGRVRRAIKKIKRLSGYDRRSDYGAVLTLSAAPPVFLTGTSHDEYLGFAPSFARRYGNVPAGFIVFPSWSIEKPLKVRAIAGQLRAHLILFPAHRFHFIANTGKEHELLEAVGVTSSFLNKNITVSDEIFRPLPGATAEFDAVYVARFIKEKRHELAALVPSLAYATNISAGPGQLQSFRRLWAEAKARNPAHVLLNTVGPQGPVRLPPEGVNVLLNRARVGLILSEEEGSNYASMEYLLAGLGVVSTPSRGGRDVFFDPDYCIVCDPTPEAVRDAVAELKARNIPREEIRERTLTRIRPGREQLLALADRMISELGGALVYQGMPWPFGKRTGIDWRPNEEHLGIFASMSRANLAKELDLPPELLAEAQLEASELRPIAEAIREKPGGSLLVFGCGNDSGFWERVNAKGVTAFIEDNATWAKAARAQLKSSEVHLVHYGTRQGQWRRLLSRPDLLGLDLPEAITGRRWDVVLVDGPPGYRAWSPGRMKAICAASQLVAPGGTVFVHDCERRAEAAFASRYLGDQRLFVEAKGRALLRGYRF